MVAPMSKKELLNIAIEANRRERERLDAEYDRLGRELLMDALEEDAHAMNKLLHDEEDETG